MNTYQATIANTIRTANRPLSTALLMERVGGRPSEVSAVCCQLMRRGWITREMRPNLRGGPLCSWWKPTKKLQAAPYIPQPKLVDVEKRILDAIDAGHTERSAIRDHSGLSNSSLGYGLERLCRKDEIARVSLGRYERALPDDDGWTPQPYIHPYRAKSLGLTR